MPTMTINRTKTANHPAIRRARPGDIRLLEDVNSRANMRVRLKRNPQSLGQILGCLELGDSVFLEGYTANNNDADPRLKYMRTQGYTRGNTRVLTVRSTEENGIKGVRVYREG